MGKKEIQMSICHERDVLKELLELLKLEKIDNNTFRGYSQDLGFDNVFGGQVLGQALSAATRTVSGKLKAHSLHGYFMLAGDARCPIVYTVDPIRDGKSFATRRVVAVQKGQAIFSMSASFHKDEQGYDHQDPMPDIQGPEGLVSEVQLARQRTDKIPPDRIEQLICRKPIEIRMVNPVNPFDPQVRPPERYMWFKAIDKLPHDATMHRCMLAYASDFYLISTSLYPHGKSFWSPDMLVASLDHALWIHRDFSMDDWLLYAMKSPSASQGRGLSRGSIYNRDGILVASVAQEGLLRCLKNFEKF